MLPQMLIPILAQHRRTTRNMDPKQDINDVFKAQRRLGYAPTTPGTQAKSSSVFAFASLIAIAAAVILILFLFAR